MVKNDTAESRFRTTCFALAAGGRRIIDSSEKNAKFDNLGVGMLDEKSLKSLDTVPAVDIYARPISRKSHCFRSPCGSADSTGNRPVSADRGRKKQQPGRLITICAFTPPPFHPPPPQFRGRVEGIYVSSHTSDLLVVPLSWYSYPLREDATSAAFSAYSNSSHTESELN
jgi:hypothetical protein